LYHTLLKSFSDKSDMRNFAALIKRAFALLLCVNALCIFRSQAEEANVPPRVKILWPRWGDSFSDELIKTKAEASDPDGTIAQVQFFAGPNLIGTATEPPFNLVWPVQANGAFNLKAVAIDTQGARTGSLPVRLYGGLLRPPFPVVEMTLPLNGAVFAAPATFTFAAEVLASEGDAGPVEFFIGTNSLGRVDDGALLTRTTPPSSVIVSNLSEGEYWLTVRYDGGNGMYCLCNRLTNIIRVVKLGVQAPFWRQDGRFQFEIVTSFPGIQTVVQASPDLAGWTPVSTNYPTGNSFLFTEAAPATDARRFYRVVLPDQ